MQRIPVNKGERNPVEARFEGEGENECERGFKIEN
jgi:hypothetical protein